MEKILNKDIDGVKNFAHEGFIDQLKEHRQKFEEAMDNDFNSAQAIGVLNELASDINSFIHDSELDLNKTTQMIVKESYKLLNRLAGILGLELIPEEGSKNYSELVNDLIDYILGLREKARKNKEYEKADQIRDDLSQMGIEVKDAPHGVEWEIVSTEFENKEAENES